VSSTKNRVTIAQVAEYAQVSTMTVSRVVNNRGQVSDETRTAVHHAMSELGYKPNRIARSLVSNKTYKIGVLVPDLDSTFFASILSSIEQVLWEHDYQVLVSNSGKSDRREQDILTVFEEDQVDGVLVFGSHLDKDQLTELLQNQKAAVVFNCEVDSKAAGQILLDHDNAIELAVSHLMNSGRSHLGYVGTGLQTYATRSRQRVFEKVVSAHNLTGWLLQLDYGTIRDSLPEYLERFPDTDGVVCFNDECAAEVLFALDMLGKRVPEDVAVIGFDDIKLAQLVTPRLTTVRTKTHIRDLGELAANMLLGRINGNEGDELPIMVAYELVIRDSAP
jgi:LacI family transcriptional regulator